MPPRMPITRKYTGSPRLGKEKGGSYEPWQPVHWGSVTRLLRSESRSFG